ncbi:hypothetical protein [Mycobacterium talmoniae]|uniref:Alpha/beta hydrolase n=1 Tax=Mycobacterium talmoniae TaxID=1858794 RepID=A0A1S1NL46_9MYCO|nr:MULTISPECIES: hypothetical protein [Mycobacterium]OHV05263.1 hypothetical protein BKN37_06275 [Mycobacterium talmoniae]PQM46813.1 hypothetical protein C1Y40_02983 [Mycobacterium talmoniae]TDH48568.1 hypothetical protein E2F47_23350 [Mycobacterium eburneum]
MATIVLVHGIAQEQSSAADLEDEWLPSLAGGLENAKFGSLADRLRAGDFDARMAFYGDIFLTADHQGLEPDQLTADEQLIAEELALDLLRSAAESENQSDAGEARLELEILTAEADDAQGALKTMAVSAAGVLDHIPWFGRGALAAGSAVNRTLAQVTRYLNEPAIHDHAIAQVNHHLRPETRVVIGHSLGSVVAYDTLRARPSNQPVPLLVTLGSPLGLSAISKRLKPQPPAFPAAVRRWVNIAAPDDVVAARRDLHPVFDRDRPHGAVFEKTWRVENGSKPHQVNFYLTKKSCGSAVADALR